MYNVFIVDDEPMIGEGLRHLINWDAYDCKVWVFHKSTDALEKALAIKPEIVITDVNMPFLNGLELISKLKSSGFICKYIILSGYSDFEFAKKGISLGVQSYILKPVEQEEVYEALDQAILQIKKESEAITHSSNQNILKMKDAHLRNIPPDMLTHLEESIDCMNFNVSKKIIDDIFSKIYNSHPASLEDLKKNCISVLLTSVKNLSQYELQMNATLGINVLSLSNTSKYDSPEKVHHWLVNIIKMVIEIKQEQNRLSQNNLVTEQIMKYIDIHFSENITLSSVAEMLYLNPCYISQLFKKNTGITFLSYITDRRVEKAKELLANTDLKISDICEKIGYENAKHFNKVFQRSTGMKPYDYRDSRLQKLG